MHSSEDIIKFIQSDDWMMTLLTTLKSVDEPDCWIAAGAIRNPIWAHLHGVKFFPEKENDVDVIFYDSSDLSLSKEVAYETRLKSLVPSANWEVRNQARMHLRNGDKPYRDCFNALEHWAETPTAIGARLVSDKVELLVPYGVTDLLGLIVRQTPKFITKKQIYDDRIEEKQWRSKWPLLTII